MLCYRDGRRWLFTEDALVVVAPPTPEVKEGSQVLISGIVPETTNCEYNDSSGEVMGKVEKNGKSWWEILCWADSERKLFSEEVLVAEPDSDDEGEDDVKPEDKHARRERKR